MDYLLALLQGLGIAAAIGIRPFLPTLLVGALAAGDIGIDFNGTDFVFLEQTAFLLVIVIAVAVFNIIDANHHTEDWTYMMPGEKPIHAHMDMQRVR